MVVGWLFALTMLVTLALTVMSVASFSRGRIVSSLKFIEYMWVGMFTYAVLRAVGVA